MGECRDSEANVMDEPGTFCAYCKKTSFRGQPIVHDPDCPHPGSPGKPIMLEQGNILAEPEDPWKHRSSGMKCRTCMWFVAKVDDGHRLIKPGVLEEIQAGDKMVGDLEENDFVFPALPNIGRCRRRAPTMSGYPVVYPTDWCGDHKLDEEKV